MPFPLSEDDMVATEAALGVRFPDEYRAKMMADNGGEVEVDDEDFQLFTFLDRTDRKRLARTSASELVRENHLGREWDGFPPDAVAIANNGAGDYLVFLSEGDAVRPTVLRWDHETRALEAVAENFADLLDSEH